jgi:hypothetical protein
MSSKPLTLPQQLPAPAKFASGSTIGLKESPLVPVRSCIPQHDSDDFFSSSKKKGSQIGMKAALVREESFCLSEESNSSSVPAGEALFARINAWLEEKGATPAKVEDKQHRYYEQEKLAVSKLRGLTNSQASTISLSFSSNKLMMRRMAKKKVDGPSSNKNGGKSTTLQFMAPTKGFCQFPTLESIGSAPLTGALPLKISSFQDQLGDSSGQSAAHLQHKNIRLTALRIRGFEASNKPVKKEDGQL